jgi:hypothetical protein
MEKIFLAVLLAAVFSACSSDDDPVDCETSGPSLNLNFVTNASNCSTNDGAIQVAASGGKEPYLFFVNDAAVESTGQISNLSAGTYTVRVEDANQCSKTISNITLLAEDFSFATLLQPNTSCSFGNGTVTINVEQLNPPYEFKIGAGNFTADNVFTGLKTGTHLIEVKDNNNCIITLSITVPKGNTGTSWANDIKPIMEKSCAISGCHNGVSRSTNFVEYLSAKSNASNIKSKTRNRSMPLDGTLTQNQIDLISCWVDDGALNN